MQRTTTEGIQNLDLKQKRSQLVENITGSAGLRHYNFCLKLCLGRVRLAGDLFKKCMRQALKDGVSYRASPDTSFYSALNGLWPSFCRFKSELAARHRHVPFDWVRPLGRVQDDALTVLKPSEREIFAHRYVNGLSLVEIAKLTGVDKNQIVSLFQSAMEKVIP